MGKKLLRQFSNLFLEAKQNKILQPNGYATMIGLSPNSGKCNNIKIPPRPPIRSTTTITSTTSQSPSPAKNQSSVGGSGFETISNESPNIKFALTTATHLHPKQQYQQQIVPHAAMNEMNV